MPRALAQRLLLAAWNSSPANAGSLEALLPAVCSQGAALLRPFGSNAQPENTQAAAAQQPGNAASQQQGSPVPEERRQQRRRLVPARQPRKRPLYRVRGEAAAAFDDEVVSFAEQLFASHLDSPPPGEHDTAEAGTAGERGVPAPQQEQLAIDAPQADAADTGLRDAAQALYASRSKARQRRAKQRAETRERLKAYADWLQQHADEAAALRALCHREGLDPEPLLVHIHTSRAEHLLEWEEEEGAEVPADTDDGDTCASASSSSRTGTGTGTSTRRLAVEPCLQAARSLLTALGVPTAVHTHVLAACPRLVAQLPDGESLALLSGLLGSRAALGEAVAISPSILLMTPARLQRRFELLAIHLRCTPAEAAALAVRCRQLLAARERTLNENARLLGSLLPARPYETLLRRFPHLLAAPLGARLATLSRLAPAELARVDLTLLASQQPTLLLTPVRQTVAAWRQLEAACQQVPEWRQELALLTQPTLSWHEVSKRHMALPTPPRAPVEAEEQAQEAGDSSSGSSSDSQTSSDSDGGDAESSSSDSSSDAESSGSDLTGSGAEHAEELEEGDGDDSWWQDVQHAGSGRAGLSGAAAVAAGPGSKLEPQQQQQQQQQDPAWFHREEGAARVAAAPGAYGTQQRHWPEEERQRARTLARLLDARSWQRQRLEYLAAEHPQRAAGLALLDVVMAPRAEFEARFPGFNAWLADRRQEAAAARQARWEARAAARAAAGAVPAAEGAGEETSGAVLGGERPPDEQELLRHQQAWREQALH